MKGIQLTSFGRRWIILAALFFVSFNGITQVDTIDEGLTDSVEINTTEGEDSTAIKTYFRTLYDSLQINLRSISPEAKKKYKDDDDFWYGNTDLKKTRREILEERRRGVKGTKKENESAIRERNMRTPLMWQPWFQTMLWIIIVIGFTAFLVIFLGNSNVSIFRKKIRKTGEAAYDEMPEDIFAINYQKEIDTAVAQGNYRLAVRLHFLQLLKKMADSRTIHYTQDKTNFDYLVELQPTRYYNSFFRVTRNYEYSWYGQFPITETAYSVIKKDFQELDRQLNRS